MRKRAFFYLLFYCIGGLLFYSSLTYTIMYHNTYTGVIALTTLVVTAIHVYLDEIRPKWATKYLPDSAIGDDSVRLSNKEAIAFGVFFYIVLVFFLLALSLMKVSSMFKR